MNSTKLMTFLAFFMVIFCLFTACPPEDNDSNNSNNNNGNNPNNGNGNNGNTPPENWPIAERWYKWTSNGSTATVDYSVASDGLCTITVGGVAETSKSKVTVNYEYTSKANTSYTYVFQAWTESGTRTLEILYYNDWDGDGTIINAGNYTIDSTHTTYTIAGQKIPKSRRGSLEFHCGDQLGTFYVKILGIYEITDNSPESKPVTERWSKYGGDTSVTLEYSVASDDVCTITVKGTPNSSAWLATAAYSYTARADTCYIYEFEAWTQPGSGERGFVLQYYYDAADGGKYLQFFPTITEERKTYTYKGSKLPKGGVRSMDFQSAGKIGTYYVKVLSITEYTPSLEYELIDDIDSPNNGTYRVSSGTEMSGAVVIPASYNGEPVTEIGEAAFRDCNNLTSVAIPASVTIIGFDAFYRCSNLATVTFAANSQLEKISNGAFHECTSLSSITIPASVTYIDWAAFWNCTSLTSIAIPANVTHIASAVFAGCTNLTSITVDSSNPNYTSENGILYNKDKIQLHSWPSASGNVTIPAGVTAIGNDAFRDCKNLTGVTIPASVTSIGWAAFCDCTMLTSITIPASVTEIYGDAFYSWTASQTINIQGHTSQASADAAWNWGEGWRNNCNAVINYLGE